VLWERLWKSTEVEECFEILTDIQEYLLEYEGTNEKRKRKELNY